MATLPATPKADVYAFGLVLWEVSTEEEAMEDGANARVRRDATGSHENT